MILKNIGIVLTTINLAYKFDFNYLMKKMIKEEFKLHAISLIFTYDVKTLSLSQLVKILAKQFIFGFRLT